MSGVMVIEIEYSADSKFQKEHPDKVAYLVSKFPDFFSLEESGKLNKKWNDGIIDSAEARELCELGVEFKVKRFKGTVPYYVPGVDKEFNHLHIHLPNFDLVGFDNLDYMEDACTDAVQARLDNGWRIICVCPPLSQRRPDYILARKGKDPK